MAQETTDSTITEIHRTRREISDRFGGDIRAIAEDAARRLAKSNRPVWHPKHDEQMPPAEPTVAGVSGREPSAPST